MTACATRSPHRLSVELRGLSSDATFGIVATEPMPRVKLKRLFVVVSIAFAFVVGCGEAAEATGGAGGVAGVGGEGGTAGVGGEGGTAGVGGEGGTGGVGGVGGIGGTGGSGGVPFEVCTLGLCMDDEPLAASCLEVFDRCVGQGHYVRCCRMDADRTCDVFGETGPY